MQTTGELMKWFRSYSAALHDPKLLRLSDSAFRFWFNILCMANDGNPRGIVPEVSDMAIILRCKPEKVRRLMAELEAVGLIDVNPDGTRTPHNWESRQHKSDDVSKRVSKHRENAQCNVTETLQKRFSNVSVTPRGRDHAGARGRSETDSDSETDTDPETHPLTPTGGASAGEPRGEDSSPPKEINSEAEARRAVDAAEELFPLSNVRTVCRQWLRDHKADRVIRAMATAQAAGAAAPTKYVQRILDSPETQHPARASPPPAESEEERRAGIERNTRLMVERLAERDAEKKARQASGRR